MAADVVVLARHVLQEITRHAAFPQVFRECPGNAAGLRCRLEDHAVSGGQRGAHATGGDGIREVPRCHDERHATGFHDDALTPQRIDDLRAIGAVIAGEVDRLADLRIALADRLAGFFGHHSDGAGSMRGHCGGNRIEQTATLLERRPGPALSGHDRPCNDVVDLRSGLDQWRRRNGHGIAQRSAHIGQREVRIRLVLEALGVVEDDRLLAPARGAHRGSLGDAGAKAAGLLREIRRAGTQGEKCPQKVVGRCVLVEPARQVGDARIDVVRSDDRGVEQQTVCGSIDGSCLRRRHALEHLQLDAMRLVQLVTQHQSPRDVEEVVTGETDPHRTGPLRPQRRIEEALVARIDIGLGGIWRLVPAMRFSVDLLHREVGALDESNLDAPTGTAVSSGRPRAEMFERCVRVGEVGLQDDAGFHALELRLVEHGGERGDGESQVLELLHVEVDELRRRARLSVAIQLAQAHADPAYAVVEGQRIQVRAQRGDLHRHVVHIRPGEPGTH